MSERRKKIVITMGWTLLGFVFACYFIVSLIATLEGYGSFSVAHSFSGKPSVFIPVVALPVLVIAIAIGIVWLFKRKRGASRRDRSNSSP